MTDSASLIGHMQQNWNLRSYHPYLLQKNLSLLNYNKKEISHLVNLSAALNKSNVEYSKGNISESVSQEPAANCLEETTHKQVICEKSNTDLKFTNSSKINEENLTPESFSLASKQLLPWYVGYPFSLNMTSPNSLFSSAYPFSNSAFMNSFPLLQSNLASNMKM